jgi:capsular polysaccharide biosynthesis protein
LVDLASFSEIQRRVAAGDFTGAETLCLGLAEHEATNPAYWQMRGDIALIANNGADAEAHYRWATMLAPDLATAWLGLSRTYVAAGRNELASNAAQQAVGLGLNSDNAIAAHQIIAHAKFSRGDIAGGRQDLARLIPLFQPKFANGARPSRDVLTNALPAALCGGDASLVRRILQLTHHPHAEHLGPVTVAPLATMQEWCGKAGVPCDVVEPPRKIKLAATSAYSRSDSYKTDPILFASIPGGQWVPGWDFAIGSDGTVLEDSGYLNIVHVFNHAPHAYFPAAKLVAHRVPERTEYIDDDVLLVSAPMHNHIGHWLIDFLPRLIGRGRAGGVPIRIAVPETLAGKKFAETLALCDVGESDIIRCRSDTFYRFRTLHIYRTGHSMPPHPTHVQYLRDLLRAEPMPAPPSPRNKRFYFSRTRIESRLVINAAEFERVLDDHGFVSVDLATLTVAQQREMLADAEILLCAIGTDVFAAYFAPPGCTVICMQWDTGWELDPYIPQTCAMLGMTHQFLLCPTTRQSKNARSWMDLDFVVDCAELDRRLREIDAARHAAPAASPA